MRYYQRSFRYFSLLTKVPCMRNYLAFREMINYITAMNFRDPQLVHPASSSSALVPCLSPLPFSSLVGGLSTGVSLNLSHPNNPRMARQPRTKLNPRNRTAPCTELRPTTSSLCLFSFCPLGNFIINPATNRCKKDVLKIDYKISYWL